MEQEPRKATDVLLELESKVNTLLDLVRSQDLVIKVLSNKLNEVMDGLKKQQAGPPKIIVETVQAPVTKPPNAIFAQMPAGEPERTVPFAAETSLPQTDAPQGFRRNSRPETYAPKTVPQAPAQEPAELGEFKMPIQIPQGAQRLTVQQQQGLAPPPGRGPGSEVVAAPGVTQVPGMRKGNVLAPPNPAGAPLAPPQNDAGLPAPAQGQIPVTQRCVNKNGKPVYLAEVEIIDLSTSQPIAKIRTNGMGKWATALGIGAYRVTIRKRESITKSKIEATQEIQVDGTQPKLELPMLIIK